MSSLSLEKVSKRYSDDVLAVDDVSLKVPQGQLTALLGPSGCGKTTLLRIIAGLESPSAGMVSLGGSDITAQSACERKFGMVFQSFALFPHLNVEDNVAYSLAIEGVKRANRHIRAYELLDLVKLSGYGKRRVGELSGGQRQRVAIARALAQDPSVFLLDEPMSALDAQLREDMQVELRLLQQELGITTIVVTHDQREAMTMADQIVVMSAGTIEQMGSPQDVYARPVSRFVASFIGKTNFLDGVVREGSIDVYGVQFKLNQTPSYLPGARVCVACRPEHSRVEKRTSANSGDNRIPASVTLVREVGPVREVFLDAFGHQLVCVTRGTDRCDLKPGDAVVAALPADHLQIFAVDQAA